MHQHVCKSLYSPSFLISIEHIKTGITFLDALAVHIQNYEQNSQLVNAVMMFMMDDGYDTDAIKQDLEVYQNQYDAQRIDDEDDISQCKSNLHKLCYRRDIICFMIQFIESVKRMFSCPRNFCS